MVGAEDMYEAFRQETTHGGGCPRPQGSRQGSSVVSETEGLPSTVSDEVVTIRLAMPW